MNFKSLPGRLWPSLVIVVGMACVIGVMVSMLSFTAGYVRSETAAGDPGRAIVLGSATDNEGSSNISRNLIGAIMDAPGIRRDADGSAIADAEILVTMPATRKIGASSTLLMRGLGPKGFELRPEMKLIPPDVPAGRAGTDRRHRRAGSVCRV